MRRVLVVQHHLAEGLGALEAPLRDAGLDLDVRLASRGLPDSVTDHQGLIVMGGSIGVYQADRYPFLRTELRLLRGAMANDIPTLGVCLGSQLIAAAGDAEVFRGPEPEVGWLLVTRIADDPWLKGWPRDFEALHWHEDTFELPASGIRLASSSAYPNQAFRLGSALGLQFHTEATAAMVEAWMEDPETPETFRPPPGTREKGEAAAARMAPLTESLAAAFARAV